MAVLESARQEQDRRLGWLHQPSCFCERFGGLCWIGRVNQPATGGFPKGLPQKNGVKFISGRINISWRA